MPRRRRRSPVPFYEWLHAFAAAQRIIARAYDEVASEKPSNLFAFGAILRITLNKVLLPAFRKKLAEHPGIESEEEIKKILVETFDEVYKTLEENPDIVKEFLRSLHVPADKIDDYTKQILEYLKMIREKIAATIKVPAAAKA